MSPSDPIPDTPIVTRAYCPGCEPEADPTQAVLEVRHCAEHSPGWSGQDDAVVTNTGAWMSGSGEAGGDDNRRWCEVLHRKKRLLR